MLRMILINEVARQSYENGSILRARRNRTDEDMCFKNECSICVIIIITFLIMISISNMNDTCTMDCYVMLMSAFFIIFLISLCACYLYLNQKNQREENPVDSRNYNSGLNSVVSTTTVPNIANDTLFTSPAVTMPPARHRDDENGAQDLSWFSVHGLEAHGTIHDPGPQRREDDDDPPPSFKSVIEANEQPPPKYEACVRATHVNIDLC